MFFWEIKKLIHNTFFRFSIVIISIITVIGINLQINYALDDVEFYEVSQNEQYNIITSVIERSQANYRAVCEYDPNDRYAINYQLEAIECYKNVLESLYIDEKAQGWNILFRTDLQLYIFLAVSIIVPLIVSQEKASGMCAIIYSSKKGRIHTIICKVGLTLLSALVITLVYNIILFFIINNKMVYSSVFVSIQSFPDFVLVPYAWTVWQYIIVWLALQILITLVFATFIFCLSSIVPSSLLCSAIGIVIYILQYITYDSTIVGDKWVTVLNMCYAGNSYQVLEKYNLLNLNNGISNMELIIKTYSFILLIMIVMTLLLPVKCYVDFPRTRIKKNKRLKTLFKGNRTEYQFLTRKHTLLTWEMYKTLFTRKGVVILIILILCQNIVLINQYSSGISDFDIYYKEYMDKIEGVYTEEKAYDIYQKREQLSTIIKQKEEMAQKYANGLISQSTYQSYLDQYYAANTENEKLQMVLIRCEHLENLYYQGITADFFYDKGVLEYLNLGFDITLYLGSVIFFCSCFASEYDSKTSLGSFALILRTTRYGRKKTFISKLLCGIVLAIISSTITFVIRILYITHVYSIKGLNSPLISISEYANVSPDIVIWHYIAFVFIIRLIGNMTLMLLINALSAIFQDSLKVMSVSYIITGIPAILQNMGLVNLQKINFLYLFNGNILLSSLNSIIYLLIIILCSMLLVIAYIKYCK